MSNLYSLTLVGAKYPQAVLASVDTYLKERKIEKGQVPFDVSAIAVATNLQNMIKKSSYFNVCDVNNAAKLLDLRLSSKRQEYYNALHCISWSAMTEQVRQDTIAMLLDDFRVIFCNKEEKKEDEDYFEKREKERDKAYSNYCIQNNL